MAPPHHHTSQRALTLAATSRRTLPRSVAGHPAGPRRASIHHDTNSHLIRDRHICRACLQRARRLGTHTLSAGRAGRPAGPRGRSDVVCCTPGSSVLQIDWIAQTEQAWLSVHRRGRREENLTLEGGAREPHRVVVQVLADDRSHGYRRPRRRYGLSPCRTRSGDSDTVTPAAGPPSRQPVDGQVRQARGPRRRAPAPAASSRRASSFDQLVHRSSESRTCHARSPQERDAVGERIDGRGADDHHHAEFLPLRPVSAASPPPWPSFPGHRRDRWRSCTSGSPSC